MYRNLLGIILFALFANSCDGQKRNQVISFLDYPIDNVEGIVTTKYDGIYRNFDFNYQNGYTAFYLIPEIGGQNWYQKQLLIIEDVDDNDDFLTETLSKKSFRELSQDFNIYVYHVDKKYLMETPELDYPYTLKIPRVALVYFLDFSNDKMIKIDQLEINDGKDSWSWLESFLNNDNIRVSESEEPNWVNKNSQVGKITLNDLNNKQILKELEWFDVADILAETPVSKANVLEYNNAAFYLIEYEKYNEARIILLKVTEKFPNRVVAWLNLADAQWGFDDKEEARNSYNKYLELMESQGKDLTKIPQRAYNRIK